MVSLERAEDTFDGDNRHKVTAELLEISHKIKTVLFLRLGILNFMFSKEMLMYKKRYLLIFKVSQLEHLSGGVTFQRKAINYLMGHKTEIKLSFRSRTDEGSSG